MGYSTYETVTTNPNIPVMVVHIDSKSDAFKELGIDPTKINYIPRHWHRSLEITYVLKGALQLNSLTEKRRVEEDDLLLVNSGIIHEVSSFPNEDTEVICLIISYDFLKEHIPNFDRLVFKLDANKLDRPKFKEIFKRILQSSEGQNVEDGLQLKSDLLLLLAELNRYHLDEDQNTFEKDNNFIIEVIEWMHENYDQALQLNDASDNFNMSREHFSRIFKQSIGESFLQYLYNYRLYRAYADILNTEKPLEDIAYIHGFPNVKSLITRFKDYYGSTPGNFRKNQKVSIIDHNNAIIRQR